MIVQELFMNAEDKNVFYAYMIIQSVFEHLKDKLKMSDMRDNINPDDMCIEELKQWFYATVRDNLLLRGLSRKEVLLLLEEYELKKRIEDMTQDQLQKTLEGIADEIYEMKDIIICHRCHSGKIKVFEDHGGYSVRCDYCKITNHCRCSTKEMAIDFWNKGIYRV